MKAYYLTVLLILASTSIFAQSFTFPAYGLVNSYSNGSVIYAPAQLIISNFGENSYDILAFEPNLKDEVSMEVKVSYITFNKEREYYVYKGNVWFGELKFNCYVISRLELLEYTKGKGNNDKVIFEKKYEIKIYYSNYGDTYESMSNLVSIYPVTD